MLHFLIIQRMVAWSLNVMNTKEENCPMKAEYQKQFVVSSGFSVGSRERQSVGSLNKVGMKTCGRKRETDGGFQEPIHRCATAKTKILTCTRARL